MAEEHDVIVVGMGVGGEEVAGRLAEGGLDVLSIERKLVGGECPYWGCIPTKMIVRAADSLAEAARVLGLAGDATISPAWAPVARRVREATANWNDQAAVERHEKKGETFLRGEARFVAPREIEADGRRFRARRGIVIATGTQPADPPIQGLSEVGRWTNREAVEADELPRSLVILGAGPVGLEIGQAFHRFGTKVTFIEEGKHALPMEEPENGKAMDATLRDEGMTLLTDASARSVERSGHGVAVKLADGRTVEGERLLVATGRKADLKSLDVGMAGLDPESPAIPVDESLRAGDGLWAVGDVTGQGAFTHVAVYQGRIAAAEILGQDHAPANYSAVSRVTFTDPEVASVGLTEAKAKQRGLNVVTGVGTTSSSARGWIHGPGAENGVSEVVADGDTGLLVGASTMGPRAGDVIGMVVLAIRAGVPIATLRDLIYPYPTFVRGLEDALRQIG